jgi:hypothetical protein
VKNKFKTKQVNKIAYLIKNEITKEKKCKWCLPLFSSTPSVMSIGSSNRKQWTEKRSTNWLKL